MMYQRQRGYCETFEKTDDDAGSIDTHAKPVSKPPARGLQGSARVDWVTVWFLGLKMKVIVSFGSAR